MGVERFFFCIMLVSFVRILSLNIYYVDCGFSVIVNIQVSNDQFHALVGKKTAPRVIAFCISTQLDIKPDNS